MRKLTFLLACLFLVSLGLVHAQSKSISGKVLSAEDGQPIIGATVKVKGTTLGTITNADGLFKISMQGDAKNLLISYVGMKTMDVEAKNNIVVKLESDARMIEELVVTAMGISREKKSLGYATQQLSNDQVNGIPTNNFINNLTGKVAGLDIKMNSNFAGSTNIVMRGIKSINGNNQALIVVDGIPASNSNLNTNDTKNGRDGFDFGNAISDIDPNNIESITVLKGAAATALYGSLASNGALMITTKKGKKNPGIGVSINSSLSIGTYDKSTFAEYQKQYGQGYAGQGSSYATDVNGDGIDDLVASTGDDASFGDVFNSSLNVYNWDAFIVGSKNYGKATPWLAAQNDPGAFFQTAYCYVNNIALSGGDDKASFNLSYSNNNETGIMPNSHLNKNSLNGNFNKKFSNKFSATSFFTFTNQSTIGRNNVGYGDNILTGFRQWWPVNVDMQELKDLYFQYKTNATWNTIDPTNGDLKPNFWNNPYWDRFENYESDGRTRFLTGAALNYDIDKHLNILGRVGIDYSNDKHELRKAIGSHAEEFGVSQIVESSGYDYYARQFFQQNYDLIATYNNKISEDINYKATLGYNFISSTLDVLNASTTGGLLQSKLYSLGNSVTFVAPIEKDIKYNKSGAYAQGSADYKRMAFIEGSYRYDKSSTLKDPYSYWSLGSSFIFTEVVKSPEISYGKLRLNYAQVGNDPEPGRLAEMNNRGSISNAALFDVNSTFVSNNLKRELTKSWEAGLELKLFNNRAGVDLSLYKTNTYDQLFAVPTSTSAGYAYKYINAGQLENKGIELSVNYTPIQTKDFKWDINLNWSKNKNVLISLDEGRDNLLLAKFQMTSLNATVGQAYGTIRGVDYQYDSNGNKLVDADGYYLTENDKVLGNIQPDWIGGIYNKFSYKNFSLGFLIDVRKGGSVFSLDQGYGQETGLYPNTAGSNDLGNPVRNALSDGGGIILPGVTETGEENTVRIDASSSAAAFGVDGAFPEKEFVYDASYVKLREVSISYNLPKSILKKVLVQDATISITGNNLWIIYKNIPMADPEAGTSSGNIQGYQSGVMPTVRTISFNLKLNF